jgi:hypothetical protein
VLGFVSDLPGPLQLAAGAATVWALAGDKITGAFGSAKDKIRRSARKPSCSGRCSPPRPRTSPTPTGRLAGSATRRRSPAPDSVWRGRPSLVSPRRSAPNWDWPSPRSSISSLADSIDRIAHAGDSATQDITAFDRSLSHIDTNAGRIDAVASRIDDLKDKIADLVNTMPSQVEFGATAFNPVALADMIANFKDGDESADRFRKQLQLLQEQSKNYEASTASLSAQLGISKDTVAELADKYGIDLTQGVETVTEKFMSSGAAADVASGAVASVGNAADLTQDQIDEAAKASRSGATSSSRSAIPSSSRCRSTRACSMRRPSRAGPGAGHGRRHRVVARTPGRTTSGVSVSLDEYATKLQEQITNQENWHNNLVIVAQRGGDDVAAQLAAMGVEGAGLVAQMANATDAEMQRMADLMRQDAYERRRRRCGGAGHADEGHGGHRRLRRQGDRAADRHSSSASASTSSCRSPTSTPRRSATASTRCWPPSAMRR